MKMKKLSLFLALSILLSFAFSMPIYADEKDKYDKVYEEARETGYNHGNIAGYLDKNKELTSDYNRDMPKDSEIEGMYKEYKDDKFVMSNIVANYKAGYIRGYLEGYTSGNISQNTDKKQEKNEKTNYGQSFGLLLGQVYGQRDFFEGKKNNWSKAKPTDKVIINMFNLDLETTEYRNSFLKDFKENFQKSYEECYREANLEPQKISYDEGLKDGEVFGEMFGKINGRKDYSEGKISNWNRNFPSGTEIRREFVLNRDSEKYVDGFLTGFKKAYEKAYNEGFRGGNVDLNKLKSETAYEDGKEVGTKVGEQVAQNDYFLKQKNDISRHFKLNSELIYEYDLYLDNERYRDGFISGYRDGFEEAYIKTYQKLNKEEALILAETVVVPTSGEEVESQDKKLKMAIPSGTYFNDVLVKLYNDGKNENGKSNKNLIVASEVYNIKILNSIKEFNKDKKIELSFEYYGPDTGGIYKFANGEWLYMPSTIEENRIKTYIVPSSIREGGSIYAVFIDKSYAKCHDIRGHWAKDEIDTYIRRKYISGYKDKKFRPDSYMTKGQFLMVLNKVYKWDLPEEAIRAKTYKDYSEYKNYEKVVEYSLNKGYISGNKENVLNLNLPMTYREVEDIMKKVTESKTFKWSNTSNKMLYQKGIRSKSFANYDNKITRGETIYMLYLLNEWKN